MKTTVLSKRNLLNVVQFVMSFTVMSVLFGGLFIFWSSHTERATGKNLKQVGLATEGSSARQSNGGSFGIQSLLAGLSSGQNNFERALALDQVLLNADTHHLKELLQETDSISSFETQEFVQHELYQRLASIDPVLAANLIEREPIAGRARLAGAIFQEWASSDLDSSIEQASTLRPLFLRNTAFDAMLEIREDLTVSEKDQIGRKLGLSKFDIQNIVSQSEVADATNFESIWNNALKSERPFDFKNSALKALAHWHINQEGLVALETISELITNWKTRQSVLIESIGWAARLDPRSTFDFALNSFSATEPHLVSEAVKHWVEREPENAFSALAQLPISRFQEKLLFDAMSYWASYEPRGLLRNLDLIPSSLHSSARNRAFSRIRDFSTQEVTRLVEEQSSSWGYFELTTIIGNWKNYAFEEALDWVLRNFDPDDSGHRLADELLFGVSTTNAELALKRVLSKPLDIEEVGFEAYVVAHLAMTDIDTALEAIPKLRNAVTKDTAIQKAAERLASISHWESAWDFGSRLPKSLRVDFYDEVIERWMSYYPARNLSRVEKLPSSELRSRAAMWAIEYGLAYGNLSQETESQFRKYLLEEDIEEADDIEIMVITSK